MRTQMKVRALAGGLALLLMSTLGWSLPASGQTVPPPPDIPAPEPPPEVDPVLASISPSVWAACDAVGTLTFLVAFGGALVPTAGLPVPPPVPPALVLSGVSTYLNALRRPCLAVPFPARSRTCELDAQPGAVPFVGQRPGAVAVGQAAAVETLLAEVVGVPVGDVVSTSLAEQAGCTA
jgi:hypothetical protein